MTCISNQLGGIIMCTSYSTLRTFVLWTWFMHYLKSKHNLLMKLNVWNLNFKIYSNSSFYIKGSLIWKLSCSIDAETLSNTLLFGTKGTRHHLSGLRVALDLCSHKPIKLQSNPAEYKFNRGGIFWIVYLKLNIYLPLPFPFLQVIKTFVLYICKKTWMYIDAKLRQRRLV